MCDHFPGVGEMILNLARSSLPAISHIHEQATRRSLQTEEWQFHSSHLSSLCHSEQRKISSPGTLLTDSDSSLRSE